MHCKGEEQAFRAPSLHWRLERGISGIFFFNQTVRTLSLSAYLTDRRSVLAGVLRALSLSLLKEVAPEAPVLPL